MSSGQPTGHPEQTPDLAAAVRIQRRRHAWALAMFWLIGLALLCVGSTSSADSNGTPPPPWFIGLTIASGVAAAAAAGIALAYSAALRRRPADVRAQADRKSHV